MAKKPARTRTVQALFGEARGRLLTELCGQPQTASELAERVGTSSNAVRVHLGGLRSAGLVDFRVERRGVGKPRHVYSTTSVADDFLSSAYAPTLQALLDALRHRLNGGLTSLLRDVGTAMGKRTTAALSARKRASVAAETLAQLGTPVKIAIKGKTRVLSNGCCPLAAVTRRTPEVCQMMEALLSVTSGLELREQCERSEHPRCAFAITAGSRGE